ncbi:MAG TPA: hypothetical protein VFC08_04665 [Actinomycetota bacterium]|jgi:hypothetical protein|nr:hypothetical protein [Actinomycetota bacterium]
MARENLVTVEFRFVTSDEPEQVADRLRESAAVIVGRDALEEFRVKTIPVEGPEEGGLRPVE